jgi:acylglycerol lipase
MMAWVQQNWHNAHFPFLLLHGTDDKICTIRGSELLMQHAPSADKRFIRYEGIRHEPHKDRLAAQERADILAWLDAHINLRASL